MVLKVWEELGLFLGLELILGVWGGGGGGEELLFGAKVLESLGRLGAFSLGLESF